MFIFISFFSLVFHSRSLALASPRRIICYSVLSIKMICGICRYFIIHILFRYYTYLYLSFSLFIPSPLPFIHFFSLLSSSTLWLYIFFCLMLLYIFYAMYISWTGQWRRRAKCCAELKILHVYKYIYSHKFVESTQVNFVLHRYLETERIRLMSTNL